MTTETEKWYSCAETAKLVRVALAKNFPGVKFSVRSSVYSGGSSIDVRWYLGPTTKEVDAIACQYESADFDGSIDMETLKDHWLLPDGSAIVRDAQGTEGSMGYIPAEHNPAPAGAVKVHFGAHYVQCQRQYFQKDWEEEHQLVEQVAKDMCALQHVEWQGYDQTVHLYGEGDTEQATQHAWRVLNETSFAPGEVYAGMRYATEQERDDPTSSPLIIIKNSPKMDQK